MKRLLATSTILALTAGVASAEITFSGDARMGIINDFGASDVSFTSRARIKFTLSGETDSGLAFGADFRADNAGAAASGTAGSVFVSGTFGKLSMGDVDGAAQAAVGNVSGVGLTGLSDLNEIAYLLGNEDPSALYEYTTGDFSLFLSGQINGGNSNYGVGASYTAGNYKFAVGYESLKDGSTPGGGWPDKIDFGSFFPDAARQVVLGADATFGAVTAKLRYAQYSESGFNAGINQLAASVDYKANALTLTAFYSDFKGTDGYDGDGGTFYGIGASYDLGGGASVVGGYATSDYAGSVSSDDAFDLGLSFSF